MNRRNQGNCMSQVPQESVQTYIGYFERRKNSVQQTRGDTNQQRTSLKDPTLRNM